MITRQNTPGPWHDAVANNYARLAVLAPIAAAHYCSQKFALRFPSDAILIYHWASAAKHSVPCPVR